MCSVLCKLLGRRFDIGVDLLLFRRNAPVLEEIIEGSLSLGVRDFLINSFLAIGRGAKHKCMEPTGEDYAKLAKLIAKFKDEASFKVSGRLASKMKVQFSARAREFEEKPFKALGSVLEAVGNRDAEMLVKSASELAESLGIELSGNPERDMEMAVKAAKGESLGWFGSWRTPIRRKDCAWRDY